jgi:hypothetical protein
MEARDHLIRVNTGSSLNYISKRMYTTPPNDNCSFKLRVAVGLDKASRGVLDFRDLIAEGAEIDWAYVKLVLAKRGCFMTKDGHPIRGASPYKEVSLSEWRKRKKARQKG